MTWRQSLLQATQVSLYPVFDSLPSFDRINLGSTLLQCAIVLGFATAQFGAARHFKRPAMRAMSTFWVLVSIAACVSIFSSWSGAVWNNRTLSRALTTVVVALLGSGIVYARAAIRALVSPEQAEPPVGRDAVRLGVVVLLLHAAGVFGAAWLLPDMRAVAVTWSRTLEFLTLAVPAFLAWRGWRHSTHNRAALELLAASLAALALRQGMRVALGLRVDAPDLSLGMVLFFVVLDVLTVTAAGVCLLLATTSEEVEVINAQSAELSRTQARLAAGERMESLGRMATGVAHDMNNVLQVLSLSWESIGHRLTRADDMEVRREAETAMEHGASLVKQLLTFARVRSTQTSRFDPAERLRALSPMLRVMAGSSIEIVLSGSTAGASLLMDPGQFEQIVVNLVSNARDALSAGGRIAVSLDLVSVRSEDAPASALRPGDYVRLIVADTGEGIPPEIRDRIFEPFFTTKEFGRGTGLGLATVHGIARQAAGDVTLRSMPGSGTSFEVFLPAA